MNDGPKGSSEPRVIEPVDLLQSLEDLIKEDGEDKINVKSLYDSLDDLSVKEITDLMQYHNRQLKILGHSLHSIALKKIEERQ